VPIDVEEHDSVRILVGSEQIRTGGVNGKISRCFSACGYALQEGECSIGRIHFEDRDAVLAAIRAVYELAVWMYDNLGGSVFAVELGS